MIRRVLNTSNDKKSEIVTKMKQKKFKLNTRRHNIEFKTTKTKITRLDLNNCNCYVF